MNENYKNLMKMAKMLDGKQLLETEDVKNAFADIINEFNRMRASHKELTQEQKDTLNLALKQLNAEHERILEELQSNKLESKSALSQALNGHLRDMNKLRDEIIAMKPKDADQDAIIEEVLERIELPEYKETILDDPSQIKDKLESLKEDKRLDRSAIKGLDKVVFNDDLNRAISILDQRSQYLVNRTVKHDNTLTGAGTDASPLSVVGGGGSGTVTDVAALTIGTTGTDLSSTVASGTTTPVITLQVPTASATNRGALSPTDWSTFNSKQAALGFTAEDVANKSTDTSLGTSDTLYPSQKAVKTYADSLVVGLLDYRGAYDASVNTFPASGGSGTAGAVLKGDMWILSVTGTLGGVAAQIGDSVIANVDTPGQTAGNWNILNANISYVPEDAANKVTSISGASTDTQYPSAKLTYDQLALKAPLTSPTFATSITGSYLTASEMLITDASKNVISAPVATYPSLTELTHVKGVTSSIQTQLNAKQAGITFGTGVQTALGVNIGSAGAPILFNGALGTPLSGTVTNLTGTASININGTVGATTPAAGTFTTVSASSNIKLANAFFLQGRNVANSADVPIVKVNASDVLEFGSGGYASQFTGPVSVAGAVSATNGADISAGDTNAIIKISRTGTAVGSGWLGANSTHSFAVHDGDLLNLNQFTIAQNTPSNSMALVATGLAVTGGITATSGYNGTIGATTPTTGVFTTLVAGSTTSLLLGTAGSAVGNIGFRNATSGAITLAPPTGALGTVTLTLPAATDTLVGKATTDTLTNKRVTKRTGTTTSSATPTINTDNVDEYYITAQAEAITSFTTNLSGTPTLGQGLFISVIGTAARAVTWGASFANGPVALPTTTVTTTQLSTFFKWDGSIWRCYASGSTV